MQKIDKVVLSETRYIAVWVLILSALMQAVFLVIGRWDYTVLLGNLLSGSVSVLNFLGLGIGVQKALEREEKEARQTLKLSQAVRMIVLFVVLVLGAWLDCFSTIAVLIPAIFPRIAIFLRPFVNKNKAGSEADAHEE